MAEITKINSGKGLVSFNQQDLIENNLLRYVRTSHKGVGSQKLLTDHPFETVAASMFKEKYPSDQVKIAEKCLCKHTSAGDIAVDVILRISKDVSDDMFAKHPTTVVFKKEESNKGGK